MKKISVFLLMLGVFSAASAQEVKKDLPLQVGVSGIVYHTAYKGVYKEEFKDVDGDYTAARIKPFFNFTDGNIEAVLTLEYDATFGAAKKNSDIRNNGGTSSPTDDQLALEAAADKSSENVGPGADKKGLEVVNAYIKSKVDGLTGLTLTGGIAYYDFPLVWGDNTPLASINFSNDYVDLGAYYVKPSEGENNKDKDDSDIYIADVKIKFGDSSVRPVFFSYQCKESPEFGEFKDYSGYIYGLSLNLALGIAGMDASGAYIQGKDKITPAKYTAYAYDIAPYAKVDPIKITAFFTFVSGDNDTAGSDDKNTSFRAATIDGSGSGINNFRLYIIEDAGSFTTNGDVTDSGKYTGNNGYMAYGLSAFATLGPVTIKLQGAYAVAQKVSSGQNKEMGIEGDANIGYALTKASTFYVEGAYLKTGKFYGETNRQNAQYINIGMTYSL